MPLSADEQCPAELVAALRERLERERRLLEGELDEPRADEQEGKRERLRLAGYRLTARPRRQTATVERMKDHSDDLLHVDGSTARVVDAGKVTSLRDVLAADDDVADLADVFALLGDANRLRILTALAEGDELCVCDVAATVGMSESAASHALRLLRAHRIVEPRRAGKMTFYRLADAHVRTLLDVAMSHTRHTEAIHPERGGDRRSRTGARR